MRPQTWIVAVALALLCLGPAFSQIIDEDGMDRDAVEYAADTGVTLDEAIERLEIQDIVGDLDATLMLEEIGSFAGLWIQHTPVFHVFVLVKDPETRGRVQRRLAKTSLRSIVKIREVEASLVELEAAQDLGIFLAAQLGIPADSGINVRSNRAELLVEDKAGFEVALAGAGLELPRFVAVVETDQLASDEADIFGGLPISTCTTGFSVKNSSGTRGVLTAAHCSNSQSYSGTSLTYQSGAFFSNYDVQWHTAPGLTVVNKIRSSCSTCERSITSTKSRSSQSVGGYVCKQGKTSGYTCGYISDKSFKPSTPSSATATFVRVHKAGTDLSSPGDSGGPWFNSNTAYGIHTCGIGDDAAYMAINYISVLGVSVLTSP